MSFNKKGHDGVYNLSQTSAKVHSAVALWILKGTSHVQENVRLTVRLR